MILIYILLAVLESTDPDENRLKLLGVDALPQRRSILKRATIPPASLRHRFRISNVGIRFKIKMNHWNTVDDYEDGESTDGQLSDDSGATEDAECDEAEDQMNNEKARTVIC